MNHTLKHLVQTLIVVVLAAALVIAALWAQGKAGGERCTVVDVEIANADSSAFVTPDGVRAQLKTIGIKTVGQLMDDINTDRIEEALAASDYVEQAECVKCPGGRLLVSATQIVPVLRVFDGDNSYYVNRAGKRVAATASYHADVPVVEGHFTKQWQPTRLLPLVDAVEAMDGQFASMYVARDSNNVFVVPRIKGHVVNFGPVTGIDSKLAKLRLFYREVMPQKGWMTYDTISLKWDHQVVATRRSKAKKVEIDYSDADDEPMADMQTMTGTAGDTSFNKISERERVSLNPSTPQPQNLSTPQ